MCACDFQARGLDVPPQAIQKVVSVTYCRDRYFINFLPFGGGILVGEIGARTPVVQSLCGSLSPRAFFRLATTFCTRPGFGRMFSVLRVLIERGDV